MYCEHREPSIIREQHRAQVSERRCTINFRPRHDVTPAPLAPLGGAAGQEDQRVGRRGRIVNRQIRILESDVTDRGDVVYTPHRRGIHAALIAKAPIETHRLELIAEDLERERFEIFVHRLVDKRKDFFVDLHVKRHGI